MKKISHTLGMKIFACFLVILMGLTSLISGIGVFFASESGFYGSRPLSFAETPYCKSTTFSYADRVMSWLNSGVSLADVAEAFHAERTNFRFELYAQDGKLLLTNFDAATESAASVDTYQFSLYYDYADATESASPLTNSKNLTIIFDEGTAPSNTDFIVYEEPILVRMKCYVAEPLTVSDHYWLSHRLYEMTYDLRTALFPILGGSFLVFAAALIYLLCAAGHQPDREEIVLNLQDKIPLDLYLFLLYFPIFGFAAICVSGNPLDDVPSIVLALAGVTSVFVLGLATIMTCATRLKLGKYFYQHTITYQVLRFFWKMFLAVWSTGLDALRSLPAMWKVAVAWLVVSSVYVGGGFGAVLLNLALMFVFCSIAAQMKKLQDGGESLAKGKLDHKIDTKKMFAPFRKHGENLNSISKGFSIALEQKMKSEHLKTELITNVSHDIKTPLTSIINYVDLLKKEGLEGQAAEYIEVLDRQSRRLKKLTEDLVEASKASTGNLKVYLLPTDMGELVAQAVAEYEERLASARLEVICSNLETPIYAMVDGNLTWRVLSNLLSNACKYSQPDTRVYIDIQREGNQVFISVKNISKDALNIPADELMERFVRGDSSRHTEGSGLGLNIAQSLVGLQKGKFSLEIEGDLFKAYIKFPATEPPAPPAPPADAADDRSEEVPASDAETMQEP